MKLPNGLGSRQSEITFWVNVMREDMFKDVFTLPFLTRPS